MARVIEIVVTGDEKGYTASVSRITEQNRKLGEQSRRSAEEANRGFQSMAGHLRSIAGLLGVSLSVGALVQFGRNVLTVADQLGDLADQTGLSMQALVAFRGVGAQTGVSVDAFARGILMAQKNLGEIASATDPAAVAIRKLGLSVQQLRNLSPDEFLQALVKGLGSVSNQSERLAIQAAILGRGGLELNSTLSKLAKEGFPEVSAETVKAYQQLSILADQLAVTGTSFTDFGARGLATALRGFKSFSRDLAETLLGLAEMNLKVKEFFGIGVEQAKREVEILGGMVQDFTKDLEAFDKAGSAIGKRAPTIAGPSQEQIKKAQAFTEALGKQNEQLAMQILKMTGAEEAVIEYEMALLRAQAATLGLTDPQKAQIDRHQALLEGVLMLTRAEKERNDQMERAKALADVNARIAEGRRKTLDEEISRTRQLADLEAERLEVQGHGREAEEHRLLAEIEARNRRARAIEQGQLTGDADIERKRADVARDRLVKLGEASVNVGHEISRAVTDIFSAAVNGTLKLADIGRSALAAAGRVATEFFAQVLNKKLGFENIIFSNLRGLPGQMNASFVAGAGSIPGAGGGGIPGVSAGGGGGIFGGGLSSIISSIGGLIIPGLGGMGIGGLIGGGAGSIGGALGGILGSLAGGLPIGITTGAGIATGVSTSLTGLISGGLGGILGPGLGSLLGGIALPGIGAIFGGILGGLFGGGPSKHKQKSPQRRLAAAQAGLTETTAAGFELTPEEVQFVQTVMQSGWQAASGGPFPDWGTPENPAALKPFSVPLLVALRESLEAKGGRATGPIPFLNEELTRRGLDPSLPLAELKLLLDQQQALQEQQETLLQIYTQALAAIKAQREELELQSQLIGKTVEEAMALRREFDLAKLAAEGLNEVQIETLRQEAIGRDALARQIQLEEERRQKEAQAVQLAAERTQFFQAARTNLERELQLLGLSAVEAQALRREFELSDLAAQGLNAEQIQSLRILAQQRDELQLQLIAAEELRQKEEEAARQAEQEAARRIEEATRLAEQQAQLFQTSRTNLERELELLGLSAVEAQALRREFELSDLAAQGLNDQQVQSLRVLAQQRDELQMQLAAMQRFEGLAESLRREVEERRFEMQTFGLAPEEAAHARREFDLGRLEGFVAEQVEILRQLMRERDDLIAALENLAHPPPANVTIQLQGGDPEEIAQRIADILSGRVSP